MRPTENLADFLTTRLERDGGFTVSLLVEGGTVHGYDVHGPDDLPMEGAFVVGGAGPIRAASFPSGPFAPPHGDPTTTPGAIAEYIERLIAATLLAGLAGSTRDGDLLLGGWIDPEDGTVWVEPVSAHPHRGDAHAVATIRGEKAFQDLATGATVYVNPPAFAPVRGYQGN